MDSFLFTSESVCDGHPDKVADQISDAVLDACLAKDSTSSVACETCVSNGLVMILGEISTKADPDYATIIRETLKDIGYDDDKKGMDYQTVDIINKINEQSKDISQAVHKADLLSTGAGDQGIMFGYATDETADYLPFTQKLAADLTRELGRVRKEGICPWMLPDGKAQVTAEYQKAEDGSLKVLRIDTVVISIQHVEGVSQEQIEADLQAHVIKPMIPPHLLNEDVKYLLNPSGRFVIGGPEADAGLTGRKIIVDTYGGWGAHGGGAFSGKDPTKVDRSGAYMCRLVAKSLVAQGFCHRCLVQVSYAIGVAAPVSVFIDSYGSAIGGLTDQDLSEIVTRNFDLRPGAIIRDLELQKPQYRQTATYGHFGRDTSWEVVRDLTHEKKEPVNQTQSPA